MNRLLAFAPLLLVAAAGPALPIRPGKWQTTVTITDMTMPGMPAGMVARMIGRPTTVTSCVTPQQAANGPRSVVESSNGKCRYTRFDAAGGRFDATLECAAGSGTMTSTSSGSYTATSIDITGSGVMTGRQGMTTKTHTVGRLVGPC